MHESVIQTQTDKQRYHPRSNLRYLKLQQNTLIKSIIRRCLVSIRPFDLKQICVICIKLINLGKCRARLDKKTMCTVTRCLSMYWLAGGDTELNADKRRTNNTPLRQAMITAKRDSITNNTRPAGPSVRRAGKAGLQAHLNINQSRSWTNKLDIVLVVGGNCIPLENKQYDLIKSLILLNT